MKPDLTAATIRNSTNQIVENLKNLKPSQELSERYIQYFENETKQAASCAVKELHFKNN